ncbi:PTS beta-glucoside transporter subunit EIIBCA [Aerococcus urinaehominis]|uniref:protein-N(pi)-phosphohistidine--sucrose phosphotransferase n=1 Tax=Aerococcus urinaehominis TaxID=128944 RepID=A0A0X8FLQ1_9LACT|nr:sucrose-specific PTS transporter subunit IIBC [Aerococcus urinaehominis]AMB99537.1 PTS beta-glucoside transporter subunit EIIBCA [Aerococcus urinaehominis]SDM34330.1 PTS system, sucrose-specific IIC component [Aerococcus urinaehominis]
MNHKEVAQRVADALGQGNLTSAAHCATRLRLVVKDVDQINQAALDEDPDLKGTFKANGQYQIIVGPGDVGPVYDELVKITGATAASTAEVKNEAQANDTSNPVMRLIKVLSDIFVPLIPALTAGGLLMALNNVLTAPGLFGPQAVVEMYPALTDVASMINMFASAPFAFLPILIGFSATKRFGGNPFLGAAAGMMLVMPDLINGYAVAETMAAGEMPVWNIFGLEIAQAGYQGQVLPVIGVAWILASLEKFFHKHLNNAVDFTFTPMLSVIITGFLTFAFVGPVLRTASDWFTSSLVWLVDTLGGLGLGVFGIFYSPIVLTGLHQAFPAVETSLIADLANTGGNFIFPVASAANVAQGAAALAIFFLTKSEKEKGLASSSALSAMLGITEPAMFGVNLKHRFPFYSAMAGAGVGALMMGLMGVRSRSLGPAGLIGFVAIFAEKIPAYMLALLASIAVSFIVTFIYGKRKFSQLSQETQTDNQAEPATNQATASPAQSTSAIGPLAVSNPVAGRYIPLSQVADPVFSQEIMGKGAAILPSEGKIYAPVTGELSVTNDSKHAYGFTGQDGLEVLIHIGIDTVKMNGQGFTSHLSQGDQVTTGQLVAEFDIDTIKAAGYDPTVMVIITNSNDFQNFDYPVKDQNTIKTGQSLIEVS